MVLMMMSDDEDLDDVGDEHDGDDVDVDEEIQSEGWLL